MAGLNIIVVVCLVFGIMLGLSAKDRILEDNVKNHRYYLEQECIQRHRDLVQLKGKVLGVLPAPSMECKTVKQSLAGAYGRY